MSWHDKATSTFLALALVGWGTGAQAQTTGPHPLGWITLGTQGGPAPNPERSQPANVLLVKGAPWIVDCGDGVMERFAAAGFTPPKADTVFISHLHVDHIGGLQGLIALHWFRGRPGSSPVTVYGPPGTDKLVAGIVGSLEPTEAIAESEQPGRWTPAASVRVVILRGGSDIVVDGVRVRAVQNAHFDNPAGHPQDNGTQSLSYRFDYQGYTIGFTGDTGPSDAVAALEHGADLLVSEVTLRGSGPGGRDRPIRRGGGQGGRYQLYHFEYQHLSPEAAGRIAATAGVKRLIFTHLAVRGPTDVIASALVEQAHRTFRGEVIVAHDLDRF